MPPLSPLHQDLVVFKKLPDLLWIVVFEQLTCPRDRYHVIQTCRKFYMLGLRELYSEISFRHIPQFLNNAPFWDARQDDMVTAPRSISVYRSFLRLPGLELSSWNVAPGEARAQMSLPKRIMQRLVMFPNIREVVFDGIALEYEFYQVLFLLQNLRELSVIDCTLPRCPEPSWTPAEETETIFKPSHPRSSPFSFEDLPITSLRITGNKWFTNRFASMFGDVAGSSSLDQDNMDHHNFLYLVTAKNLHTLHTSWNVHSGAFFKALIRHRLLRYDALNNETELSSEPGSEMIPYVRKLPSNIHTLRLTTRTKSDWLRIPHLLRHREQRTYTTNLARFLKALTKSGNLRSLSIEGYVYPFRLPRERVRLTGLESYEGPLEFLRSVWGLGVNLKRVKIVELVSKDEGYSQRGAGSVRPMDDDHDHSHAAATRRGRDFASALSWTDLSNALSEKRGRNYAAIEELDIKILGPWTDDIMRDVVDMFRRLKDLRIEVEGGAGIIDQLSANSLARQYLASLPYLQTFHLYNTPTFLTTKTMNISPRFRAAAAGTDTVSQSFTLSSGSGVSTPLSTYTDSTLPSASSSSTSLWTSISPLSCASLPHSGIKTRLHVSPGSGSLPTQTLNNEIDRRVHGIIQNWAGDLSAGASARSPPPLTEIRLTNECVWRRASPAVDDVEWCKRPLDVGSERPATNANADTNTDSPLLSDGDHLVLVPDVVVIVPLWPRAHPVSTFEMIGAHNEIDFPGRGHADGDGGFDTQMWRGGRAGTDRFAAPDLDMDWWVRASTAGASRQWDGEDGAGVFIDDVD